MKISEIAKEWGVARSTARYWVHRLPSSCVVRNEGGEYEVNEEGLLKIALEHKPRKKPLDQEPTRESGLDHGQTTDPASEETIPSEARKSPSESFHAEEGKRYPSAQEIFLRAENERLTRDLEQSRREKEQLLALFQSSQEEKRELNEALARMGAALERMTTTQALLTEGRRRLFPLWRRKRGDSSNI